MSPFIILSIMAIGALFCFVLLPVKLKNTRSSGKMRWSMIVLATLCTLFVIFIYYPLSAPPPQTAAELTKLRPLLGLGRPDLPDQPLSDRIAVLKEKMASRPNQSEAYNAINGHTLKRIQINETDFATLQSKALKLIEAGDLDRALLYWEKLITVDEIQNLSREKLAYLHANYGFLLKETVGGYVSPESEAAFRKALQYNGDLHLALYGIGEMYRQNKRFDLAVQYWLKLSQLPEHFLTPHVRALLPDLAYLGGVTLPETF